jgi:hypothetical protein
MGVVNQGVIGWVLGFHVPVVPLENDAQQVCTMVVKVAVIIRLNPVMDSHRIAEKEESPPHKVGAFWYSKFFGPSNLKQLKWFSIRAAFHKF